MTPVLRQRVVRAAVTVADSAGSGSADRGHLAGAAPHTFLVRQFV